MRTHPHVEYDPEADALYVTLLDAEIETTVELDDLRMIDYSADNHVVGVEFVSASAGINLQGVPSAEIVELGIRRSGRPFKVLV